MTHSMTKKTIFTKKRKKQKLSTDNECSIRSELSYILYPTVAFKLTFTFEGDFIEFHSTRNFIEWEGFNSIDICLIIYFYALPVSCDWNANEEALWLLFTIKRTAGHES